MILGIDFGTSTTDYVVMDKEKIKYSGSIYHNKYGIKDVFLKIPPRIRKDIAKICATGAGSTRIPKTFGNIPVAKVNEIAAIGKGGCFVSSADKALVVSIGSGTAMVSVINNKIRHIGGTSVGGGTLVGLSQLLLHTDDVAKIERLAEKGNLEKVDISLKSIYPEGIGLLPPKATASHFGSLKNPKKTDIAKGIVNLIAQSIGTLSVFGAKAYGHRKIILTGKITQLKVFKDIIVNRINTILEVPVIIPKNAGTATAIGAVIAARKNSNKA